MTQNVCFIGSFTAGGTERVTYLLANELLHRYDDIIISVLNFKDNQPSFPLSPKVQYSCIPVKRRLQIIRFIRQYIKRKRIDTLVCIEALTGLFTIPSTFGLGCRKVVWEHANYYQKQNSRWTGIIRKIWMQYADYYVVLTKRDLENFKRNESPKCELIHIYNPVRLLRVQESPYNVRSKKILSVGHVLPIKNFEIIPDIVKRYVEDFPEWTWEIYGGGTFEAISSMKAKIREYGLERQIILKGRTDKIDDAYENAAIFALTSLQEGLPTVLLEAMLHGLPCVSFDIETGPDEIITDGLNGFMVPPYDIEKYAAALIKLMESENVRASFSTCTRLCVHKFNLEDSVDRWHNVISGLGY